MFLACGVGAFGAGVFHLMTHAFFKGLLFLAAGSVIHAMGGEQDMRNMGGLRKQIPVTYWTMLIATLAIAGIPGFSGFFSKDAILSATYLSPYGGGILWIVGALTVLLTSFYMFRLIFLTFFGKPEYDEHKVHVHESPKVMLVPLLMLAVLSVIGGWQAAPALWGGEDHFEKYLAPVFESQGSAAQAYSSSTNVHSAEQQLTLVAFALAALGFFVAWWLCIKNPGARKKLAESFSAPYKLLMGKYFVDELYNGAIVRPIVWGSDKILWHTIDEGLIDGSVNGIARITSDTGDAARHIESGNTRSYATWMVIGAVVFTSLLLWLAVR
jgi:NADH-quinone oxidoreductase subunit L